MIWQRAYRCIVELDQGLKKATTELSRHMALIKVAVERDAKKKKDAEDKAALSNQMEVLKKRAEDLKTTSKPLIQLPLVFSVPASVSVSTKEAPKVLADMLINGPVLFTEREAVCDWANDKLMQQVMAGFGTKYNNMTTFREKKRTRK